jgi:hypothetical protein
MKTPCPVHGSPTVVPSPHARLARLLIGLYRLWVQHLIQHLLGVASSARTRTDKARKQAGMEVAGTDAEPASEPPLARVRGQCRKRR